MQQSMDDFPGWMRLILRHWCMEEEDQIQELGKEEEEVVELEIFQMLEIFTYHWHPSSLNLCVYIIIFHSTKLPSVEQSRDYQ